VYLEGVPEFAVPQEYLTVPLQPPYGIAATSHQGLYHFTESHFIIIQS
jgi:hypothetical protein